MPEIAKKAFYKFANKTRSTADEKTMMNYTKRHGEPVESIIMDIVPVENILTKFKVPKDFELLCCDVEGNDLEALQSVNFHKFRPKVILVEIKLYNFLKPFDFEIVTFLYDNDYVMIAKTPLDGFLLIKMKTSARFQKICYRLN